MKTLLDAEIIEALGGTAAVARLCRIRPPSVSGWKRNGIPSARRQLLEYLHPDIFEQHPLQPTPTPQTKPKAKKPKAAKPRVTEKELAHE